MDAEVFLVADLSDAHATPEILSALDSALSRANPVDANLMRQFITGRSYAEIGETAGLTISTVKVRLHRLRPFLRSRMGEMAGSRAPGTKGGRSNVTFRLSQFTARASLTA